MLKTTRFTEGRPSPRLISVEVGNLEVIGLGVGISQKLAAHSRPDISH